MDTPLAPIGPILVVEDDEVQSAVIRSFFERRSPGAVVRIASTGHEALDYLEGIPPYDDRAENPLPEVIILDLNLPDMNGFEVLSVLFVSKEHSDIPVIVFTSSADPEDERMAYSLGALAYKSKPYNFGDLADIAMDVLQRGPGRGTLSPDDDDSEQES